MSDLKALTGRFITFEGGEGAGKTTQITLLAERLSARGLEVLVTREPGGTPGAEAIRSLILSGAVNAFGPLTETLLFFAARRDHIEKTIRPALDRGAVVLCDRFTDSTRAYQGALGAVDAATLDALETIVQTGLKPDATVLIDIPPDEGLRRAAVRRGAGSGLDRFEAESIAFHDRVRSAFLEIAAGEPSRVIVVAGALDAAALAHLIWSELGARFAVPAVADSTA
ncbi:MAG: dTMP kinase [Beijerinckiaceae bacterium]|nr:dTMP kinase [Beijerinckiaceae bacterium]